MTHVTCVGTLVKAFIPRNAGVGGGGHGGAPRSGARTNDLDHPEDWRRLGMGRLRATWGRPALTGCSTSGDVVGENIVIG